MKKPKTPARVDYKKLMQDAKFEAKQALFARAKMEAQLLAQRDNPPPPQCVEPIRERGLLQTARQLIGFIGDLEAAHSDIRGKLLSSPVMGSSCIYDGDLESLLGNACTRVACLVGDARTISNRLGE